MKRTDELHDQYESADLNLASFLRCRGFPIKVIRREDRKTVFVFANTADLQRTIVDYANDGAVGVRSFSNTLRDLKALTRQPNGRER
ncbi:MAG: DUF5659 domain-containing protein [Bryobacteraceae bacterium]